MTASLYLLQFLEVEETIASTHKQSNMHRPTLFLLLTLLIAQVYAGLICSQSIPKCPKCPIGTICHLYPQTETNCSRAECIRYTIAPHRNNPPHRACPMVVPDCSNCPSGQKCEVGKNAVTGCSEAKCVEELDCVVCTMMVPECPTCAEGKKCAITNASCTSCPTAICI
ncbi:hypothetical protein PROFUN_02065 [Planoprotostelium fungivorum]|uniref:Membrane anchor Opy2 N-terminal domain-containing protein n=1 Tax=Planoprotostelium fungivorum TaxID=1890364 RepID=A0A2P6NBB0_9EUKA|nr:hypothetical protein PROFUN_02065 [Planoprotostelium fungivorum]